MSRHSSVFPLLVLALCSGCGAPEGEQTNSGNPWFEDVADNVGLDFTHVRALTQRNWLPEIMSGGAAWLDYDNDGDPDLYLVQGGGLDPACTATKTDDSKTSPKPREPVIPVTVWGSPPVTMMLTVT